MSFGRSTLTLRLHSCDQIISECLDLPRRTLATNNATGNGLDTNRFKSFQIHSPRGRPKILSAGNFTKAKRKIDKTRQKRKLNKKKKLLILAGKNSSAKNYSANHLK